MLNKKIVCPKCGECENLHINYNHSKSNYAIDDVLCNECGEFFDIDNFSKEKIKQTVMNVIVILNNKQDDYIDFAENIHDGLKNIERHLSDDNLAEYINDFIGKIESALDGDLNGTLKMYRYTT